MKRQTRHKLFVRSLIKYYHILQLANNVKIMVMLKSDFSYQGETTMIYALK